MEQHKDPRIFSWKQSREAIAYLFQIVFPDVFSFSMISELKHIGDTGSITAGFVSEFPITEYDDLRVDWKEKKFVLGVYFHTLLEVLKQTFERYAEQVKDSEKDNYSVGRSMTAAQFIEFFSSEGILANSAHKDLYVLLTFVVSQQRFNIVNTALTFKKKPENVTATSNERDNVHAT